MSQIECPKCGSPSLCVKRDHQDVWLHCLCGYLKIVETKLKTATIEFTDDAPVVKLPQRGTRLWNCLVNLIAMGEGSTADLTTLVNYRKREKLTVGEVASALTVLRYRKLVIVVESRKGVPGGSVWTATQVAFQLSRGTDHGSVSRSKQG